MTELIAPLTGWIERIGAEASILTLVLLLGYLPVWGMVYRLQKQQADAASRMAAVMSETAGAVEDLSAAVTEARHEIVEYRNRVDTILLALATGRSDVPR